MSKKRIIIIISVILFFLILIGLFYLFVVSGGIFSLSANPGKPQITYGEFPISVSYEVDGEYILIQDTIICEFDGYESLGSAGKYRKWKSYLKSGNDHVNILKEENANMTYEIYITYGLAEYYMGDYYRQSREQYENVMRDNRYFGYVQWEDNVKIKENSITKEEAFEKYKVKVIEVEYSQPIQNSFR